MVNMISLRVRIFFWWGRRVKGRVEEQEKGKEGKAFQAERARNDE